MMEFLFAGVSIVIGCFFWLLAFAVTPGRLGTGVVLAIIGAATILMGLNIVPSGPLEAYTQELGPNERMYFGRYVNIIDQKALFVDIGRGQEIILAQGEKAEFVGQLLRKADITVKDLNVSNNIITIYVKPRR